MPGARRGGKMAKEASVTLIFLVPTEDGNLTPIQFDNIVLNTEANIQLLKPAILNAFANEISIGQPQDVILYVPAPDGTALSKTYIQEGDSIVLMPKYSGPLVKRP
jgi:hypothetical protein